MKIKGIPLIIHPTWIVIFILFTWSSQGQIVNSANTPLPLLVGWGLGLISSILLFLSILLHELGHSFVALHEGVKVRSITLFMLGGVAKIEKECSKPMGCLRVAAAGPLVSFFLALILFRSGSSIQEVYPVTSNLLKQLGSLNFVLALFNLLPGLPLDGGMILKALVWQLTGSQTKGIQVANFTGKSLSLFAIIVGIWLLINGGGGGSLWIIMLGWFGLAASRTQSQMLSLQKILNNLKVANAIGRKFRVLEDDESLRKFSQIRGQTKGEKQIPQWILICKSGRWLGYLNDQSLINLPVQNWDNYCVGDFISPLNELPSISEKLPLWQAIIALEKSSEGRLLVFNKAGLPSGTIDRINVGEAVLKQLGLTIPRSLIETANAHNAYPLGMSLPQVVDTMISTGIVDKSSD